MWWARFKGETTGTCSRAHGSEEFLELFAQRNFSSNRALRRELGNRRIKFLLVSHIFTRYLRKTVN
jgi:hypothetical protein